MNLRIYHPSQFKQWICKLVKIRRRQPLLVKQNQNIPIRPLMIVTTSLRTKKNDFCIHWHNLCRPVLDRLQYVLSTIHKHIFFLQRKEILRRKPNLHHRNPLTPQTKNRAKPPLSHSARFLISYSLSDILSFNPIIRNMFHQNTPLILLKEDIPRSLTRTLPPEESIFYIRTQISKMISQ